MAEQSETLAYAANDPEVIAPWRRGVRFRWVPAGGISFFVLFLYDLGRIYPVFGHRVVPAFFSIRTRVEAQWGPVVVALVLPLFIKRRGARRLLLALPFCVVICLLVMAQGWVAGLGFAGNLIYATWLAAAFMVVAGFWRIDRQWRIVAGIPAMAAVAGMVWLLTLVLLDWQFFKWTRVFWFRKPPWTTEVVNLNRALVGFAWLGLAWGGVVALEIPGIVKNRRRNVLLAWAVMGVVVAGVCGYLSAGRVQLVATLLPGKPSSMTDVEGWDYLLAKKPSVSTWLRVYRRFDWPQDWPSEMVYKGSGEGYMPGIYQSVALLPDDDATAEELARILKSHPAMSLADLAAPKIAAHRCYEAAPVLLHYALFGGVKSCQKALVEMEVPQAAWALLYGQNSALLSDVDLPPPEWGAEITRLLGTTPDLGELALGEYLAAKGAGHGGAVPEAVSNACDREVAVFRKYLDALGKIQAYLKDHPEKIREGKATVLWKTGIFTGFTHTEIAKAAGLEDPAYAWAGTATPADEPAVVDRFARDVDAFLAAQAATEPVSGK